MTWLKVKKRSWERCQWFGLGNKWRRIRATDRRDVGTRGEQKKKTTERYMRREKLGVRSRAQTSTVVRDNGRYKQFPTGGLKRTVKHETTTKKIN